MKKRIGFRLFPRHSDPLLIMSCIILVIFGSFMIMSAEMGESSADISIISNTILKQVIIIVIAILSLNIIMRLNWHKMSIEFLWALYVAFLIALFVPRLYAPVGGAYAWIRISGFSIQPSEFAKVFVIYFGSRLLGKENDRNIMNHFQKYVMAVLIYFIVIVFVEKDFGSAFVLLLIAYIIALLPSNKELRKTQNIMIVLAIFGIIFAVTILLIGTNILERFKDNYMVARFLASANPFEYQYDAGYHLVMSLVSFATGGLFGVGYTNSIHKYMNFPNPSTDFILPVIIEEMGIVFGLVPILIFYGLIIGCLVHHSKKSNILESKMVITGAYIYLVVHFIFNVGGVSGFIPLTGVPLLLISSGGSSLWAYFCAIGFVEYEIIRYRKGLENENNSREI